MPACQIYGNFVGMPSSRSISKTVSYLKRNSALLTLKAEMAAAKKRRKNASRVAGRGTPARTNNKHKGALTKKGGARGVTRKRC